MKRERSRRAEAEAALADGGSSRRAERVASGIHRVLGQVLVRDIRDRRAAIANITRVRVTPDLRHARVYFAHLCEEPVEAADTTAALVRAAPYLRRRLAEELGLRFTPDLEFFFDEELADARRVDSLLRSLNDDESSR